MKASKITKTLREKLKAYPSFYRKVWLACAQIPAGETRSYGWIAKRIGSPRAARAVGQALAKNPFAPAIPCHRVVASNGKLTGYSGPGGIAAKRRMLLAENKKVINGLGARQAR